MKAPSLLGSIPTVASSRETSNQQLFYTLAAKLSSALGFARSLRASSPPPPPPPRIFLNILERLHPRNEAIERRRGGEWHRAIHAWSINSNEGSPKDYILDIHEIPRVPRIVEPRSMNHGTSYDLSPPLRWNIHTVGVERKSHAPPWLGDKPVSSIRLRIVSRNSLQLWNPPSTNIRVILIFYLN